MISRQKIDMKLDHGCEFQLKPGPVPSGANWPTAGAAAWPDLPVWQDPASSLANPEKPSDNR
jgi:hypothetical protein